MSHCVSRDLVHWLIVVFMRRPGNLKEQGRDNGVSRTLVRKNNITTTNSNHNNNNNNNNNNTTSATTNNNSSATTTTTTTTTTTAATTTTTTTIFFEIYLPCYVLQAWPTKMLPLAAMNRQVEHLQSQLPRLGPLLPDTWFWMCAVFFLPGRGYGIKMKRNEWKTIMLAL